MSKKKDGSDGGHATLAHGQENNLIGMAGAEVRRDFRHAVQHPFAVAKFLQAFGRDGPKLAARTFIDPAPIRARRGEARDLVTVEHGNGVCFRVADEDVAARANRY